MLQKNSSWHKKPKMQKFTLVMLHNLASGILPPLKHREATHCYCFEPLLFGVGIFRYTKEVLVAT
jgi:hypothetical protein